MAYASVLTTRDMIWAADYVEQVSGIADRLLVLMTTCLQNNTVLQPCWLAKLEGMDMSCSTLASLDREKRSAPTHGNSPEHAHDGDSSQLSRLAC